MTVWRARERGRTMAMMAMAGGRAIPAAMASVPTGSQGSLKNKQNNVPEYVEVVIEVPKGSGVKRRPDGSVDIVVPIPCPFNYGSVPSVVAADGDPLDAIVIGDYLPYGHRGTWRVKGMLKFTDAGLVDNKLVCVQPYQRCNSSIKQNPKSEPLKAVDRTTTHFTNSPDTSDDRDISLLDWLSLSCIFSGYAVFKGALNAARGKHGSTSFNGWDFYD